MKHKAVKHALRYRCKAEMTVFLSLIILLIASLIFALLETARFYGLRADAEMDSALETESVFAGYDLELLEEYGLFYMDDSYGSGTENFDRLLAGIYLLSQENLDPDSLMGGDFYRMELAGCKVECYETAADRNGNAFKEQAVSYMQRNFASIAAAELYQKVTEGQKVEEEGEYSDSLVSGAGTAIAEAKQEEAEKEAKDEEIPPAPQIEFENPLELFSALKGNGILALTLPEGSTLSTKAVNTVQTMEKRNLYQGNYEMTENFQVTETLLYFKYLDLKLGNFTQPKEEHALDYELEYLIGGKSTDSENLEAVVNRILLLREAANFAYLHTDTEKYQTADTIALSLAGVTANPAIIFAVREGILAAWAYVESLQDVRTLLSGGKIPLMKTAEDWTTDVLHPATSFGENKGAKENSLGFSYEDYLMQFLFLMKEEKVNYRAMDMIENTLRQYSGKENLRMDCMIQRLRLHYTYEASPFFLAFVKIGDIQQNSYVFERTESISYLT